VPQAEFVEDVTIPDGTVLTPGQAFTKTWRFRNNGTLPWGKGVKFVFVEGKYDEFQSEKMGGPDFVDVPDVAPGQTVDVSVNLVAPKQPGRYRSYWRFKLGDGTWMRKATFTEIFVASPEAIPPGQKGVKIEAGGRTMTLPCGSPIPPGWVCTCNCITVPAPCPCVDHVPATVHYWYPC
jgi:hypothetical protein